MSVDDQDYYLNPFMIQHYQVNKDLILKSIKNPTKVKVLDYGVTLYLKHHSNRHLNWLLTGVYMDNPVNAIAFSFWIPQENLIIDDLLESLKSFANRFGCRIKIDTHEDYFVEKAFIIRPTTPQFPDDLFEILGSPFVDCESFVYYHITQLNSEFHLKCFCCFAISRSRYFMWLYQVPLVILEVRQGWETLFKELLDIVSPLTRTPFKILTKKIEPDESRINIKDTDRLKTEILIPEIYMQSFENLSTKIFSLSDQEKILVLPVSNDKKCIFCDSFDLSREHIIPQWMKAYFSEIVIQPTLLTKFENENLFSTLTSGVSDKQDSSYGFVLKQVCKECNSNWMAELEAKVKSILTQDAKKLKFHIQELNLEEDNCRIVAQWCTIKILLSAIKQGIPLNLPEGTFESLRHGDLPDGLIVEIAETDKHYLNFSVSNLLDVAIQSKKVAKEKVAKMIENFWCASFHVGNFIFRVSFSDPNKNFKRASCVVKTKVLHPFNEEMHFMPLAESLKDWNQTEKNLLAYLFTFYLIIIDS